MQRLAFLGLSSAVLVASACSASKEGNAFGTGGANPGSGGGSAHGAAGPGAGGEADVGVGVGGTTSSGPSACNHAQDADEDGDGFTVADGDCNDCDPNVNPGAVDVIVTEPQGDGGIPDPADEDCDGTADNVVTCDDNLALDDTDPMHAAQAIDLCQQATPADKKWGVLEANWVHANGTPTASSVQNGIMDSWGTNVNVQVGKRLLVLSSGAARTPVQPGACGSQTCSHQAGTPPAGFPQGVPNCAGSPTINDDVGLDLKIRAPKNATGYKFLFKFQSFEFPEWVCTSYNDQFIALVNPPPAGSINGNITFDSNTNPVSVNIAFFDVCNPSSSATWAEFCFSGCPPLPNPFCPSGPTELQGTGFDVWGDAGGTSWLQTQAPIGGGEEFSIRFAIWDTGDMALDSTAVIDGFQWIATPGVSVGTGEVPTPK